MRILICDDDKEIIILLKNYLIDFFRQGKLETPNIVSYTNGESLLADTNQKDIIFLDIEMSGLNGIFVGQELKKQNQNTIIFIITSYIEYLDEAMRFHVFRYLSKPLDKQRLFKNLKDAIQLYNSTNIKVPIETKSGISTCLVSDIIFVEAQSHKVIVYTLCRNFISIYNMAHWISLLKMPCFFQSHRSFIVNLKYVTAFDHSLIHLYNNQYTAYLTKRKYTQFKDAYFLYLENMR